MSYGLLWIETLALALLWVAALIAVAAHVRRRLPYALLVLLIILLPLTPLALLSMATGLARFIGQTAINNSFGYSLSLTICFIIGALALLHFAQQPADTPTARAAAAWPRSKLLLSLLVAAGIWTMTLWNIELEARAQLAAMRTEAGAILLSVMPPPVNDDQNAALIYEKAFQRLHAEPGLKDNDSPLNYDKDVNDPAVVQLLVRHSKTIGLIRQATALPDCLFEHDYVHAAFSVPMPECEDLRYAAELLRLNIRQEAAQGHLDTAIDDFNAMGRLARHIGRSPFLVTTIISGGVDALAAQSAEEILPKLTTVDQVMKLKLGDPERMHRSMRRALLAEEALGIAAFCDIMSGWKPVLPPQLDALQSGRNATGPGTTFLRFCVLGDDFAEYRQIMERYRELSEKPYYQVHEAVRKITEGVYQGPQKNRGFFTILLLPAASSVGVNATRYAATLKLAHIALAATRYRIEKGALPDKLESLVPDYLPEIPLDPFDGKPLRMKLAGDKLLIYSVGPDLQDNGGTEYDPKTRTADIVFSLKFK